MDADSFIVDRYLAEIGGLIAAIEAQLDAVGDDREARLQREAFRERRDRARAMAERLQRAAAREHALLAGDAQRLREALRLSRAFFSRREPTAA